MTGPPPTVWSLPQQTPYPPYTAHYTAAIPAIPDTSSYGGGTMYAGATATPTQLGSYPGAPTPPAGMPGSAYPPVASSALSSGLQDPYSLYSGGDSPGSPGASAMSTTASITNASSPTSAGSVTPPPSSFYIPPAAMSGAFPGGAAPGPSLAQAPGNGGMPLAYSTMVPGGQPLPGF